MSISRVAVLFLCLSGCSHLMYQPTKVMYLQHPEELDPFREVVSFQSKDGTKLSGWFFKARSAHKGTVIQFHGNAENMSSHFASLFWMINEGYDFFTFDYRGYGMSEGTPNQKGVDEDSLAAIQYVMKREKTSATATPDLVLYGQSLGGAILMRAFDDVPAEDKKRVKAVVIESSFANYHAVAREVLSQHVLTWLFQPLAYVLVSNEYGAEDSIPRISPTPLYVMHGDQDRVIPQEFGRKIYELAKEPKQFFNAVGAEHILCLHVGDGKYRASFLDYLDSLH